MSEIPNKARAEYVLRQIAMHLHWRDVAMGNERAWARCGHCWGTGQLGDGTPCLRCLDAGVAQANQVDAGKPTQITRRDDLGIPDDTPSVPPLPDRETLKGRLARAGVKTVDEMAAAETMTLLDLWEDLRHHPRKARDRMVQWLQLKSDELGDTAAP